MTKLWLTVGALTIPIIFIWGIQMKRSLYESKRAPHDTMLSRTQSELQRDLKLIQGELSNQIGALKRLASSPPAAPEVINDLARQIAGYSTTTATSTGQGQRQQTSYDQK